MKITSFVLETLNSQETPKPFSVKTKAIKFLLSLNIALTRLLSPFLTIEIGLVGFNIIEVLVIKKELKGN